MDVTNFITYIKGGSKKAMHYIIRKYAWIVKTVTAQHFNLCEDYQERCIEEVFSAVWENIEYYDEWGSTFENWIAGIARYHALEYKRKYLEDVQPSKEQRKMIEDELASEREHLIEGLDQRGRRLFSENIYCALNGVKTSSNDYAKEKATKKEVKKWELSLKKKLEEKAK